LKSAQKKTNTQKRMHHIHSALIVKDQYQKEIVDLNKSIEKKDEELIFLRNSVNKLKEKIDELEFKIEGQDTLFKQQQVIKIKSHENNAELRKENEKLSLRITELIDVNKGLCNPMAKECATAQLHFEKLKEKYLEVIKENKKLRNLMIDQLQKEYNLPFSFEMIED
tara:strand:- start:1 stop:501 length:501 start_codon:yes stop_codon:yes gene_type:complete